MVTQEKTFNQILLEAIAEALNSIFGLQTARSVNFYVDPRLVLKSPELYAKLLEKMFGEGAKIILARITGQVVKKFAFEGERVISFEQAVRRAKLRYLKHLAGAG